MGGKTSLDLGNAGGGTSLKHLLSTEIKKYQGKMGGEPESSLPTALGWADCSDWTPSLPGYQGLNQLNITFF